MTKVNDFDAKNTHPSNIYRIEENVVIEDIIPKVLKERSTISVVNKQGDTIGYITANELSDALTKH
jgi:ABC-type proline/glycine betaine transport system ATPase subunit